MEEYQLWCYAKGDRVCFQVSILPSQSVDALKEKICNKTPNFFAGIDYKDITLTKVDGNISIASVKRAISGGGQYQPDASVKDELSEEEEISEIWIEQPPKKTLHVFVRLPSAKRQRLDDEPDSSATSDEGPIVNLREFWKSLWLDKVNPFREDPVHRDPNPVEGVDVPATVKVLHLTKLPDLIQDVMIRDEYDEAMKGIEGHWTSTEGNRGVVIIGHPGIGKTILLYYILAKRLLENKPTVLQNDTEFVYVFDDKGCHVQKASSYPYQGPHPDMWALVDLGQWVPRPARFIHSSSFFVIMASSPKPARWNEVQAHRGPISLWFMKPFSLAELIQARQLQPAHRKEADIENFFELYGPSARDCYGYCMPGKLGEHDRRVRIKVNQMPWKDLTKLLVMQLGGFDEMDSSTHTALLVEPDPTDRAVPRTRIMTKTISQILWNRDLSEQWQNHHRLFQTLSRDPRARGFLGDVFEPAFHALCVRGADFSIYPSLRTEHRVYYHFTNDRFNETGSEGLSLRQYSQTSFNHKTRPISDLLANHYYQPLTLNNPSYDSFIYDANSHRISAFQVTVAKDHDLVEEGVKELCALGRRLEINDLKIRIIVVVLQNAQATYKIKKTLFHDLEGLEVYFLEVTEDQLYTFS